MSKHKETMSNVDTAWLQMDRPTNLMMIASFMTFDEPINYERLLATIERRLLIFDRFRQRVVPPRLPFGNYTWEDAVSYTHLLIETRQGARRWSTVGASANIIDASWRALADSMEYALVTS